jgi:PKD repeat protein
MNENGKRKLLAVIFAIWVSFILISTIPYIAEQNLKKTRSESNEYSSKLEFPNDGEYSHFKYVELTNNTSVGKIELKYTFNTNTLYIQKLENVNELTIDCKLLYENKYKKVFGKDPIDLEYLDIFVENDGLFTVIINTDTPMTKLQFIDTPLPKRVLVNKADWWETNTSYYSVDKNNVTITHIPKGSTTVEIYFKEDNKKRPSAMFVASNYIALTNETITFDASKSFDEDGSISDYLWTLGDFTKDSGKIINHSYSTIGNYSVTLTVRDNDELVDFYSENITVIDSNKSFKKIIVNEVPIDIRTDKPQNISIDTVTKPPEVPEPVGQGFNFFINVTADDKKSKFQFKINIGFIGGSIIPAGTDPESIKLFYYDEEEKKWIEIEDSYYDPQTGILTAKVDHLTVFAPMSNEASGKSVEKEKDEGTEQIILYIVIILVVIGFLSFFGLMVRKRQKKEKVKKTKQRKDDKSRKREVDADDDDDLEDLVKSISKSTDGKKRPPSSKVAKNKRKNEQNIKKHSKPTTSKKTQKPKNFSKNTKLKNKRIQK